MASVWDLYLDADDAALLFAAIVTLERHRWVREPLPLDDAVALRERFNTIARIAGEDALYWSQEADDRREAAEVDGGRWGTAQLAQVMSETAADLAAGSRKVEVAVQAAAEELSARMAGRY
ncbi:hypothetical protein [Egicoccus halophilus]|uniref:Uncharacterized protein n=1 Tax=Egicoccus halophilus TaxID=1670830 RepID=A0A8J3ETW8_9ACTN|nr:hypothetical protein [Egicoccus halophilus]GGI04743.1 hypothetical protein GCM10011354_10620 [Egicoccus halophilus]